MSVSYFSCVCSQYTSSLYPHHFLYDEADVCKILWIRIFPLTTSFSKMYPSSVLNSVWSLQAKKIATPLQRSIENCFVITSVKNFLLFCWTNGDSLISIFGNQSWPGCTTRRWMIILHQWSHHLGSSDLYLDSLVSPATVCLLRFSSSEKRLFPAALLLSSSPFTPHEILLSFFSSSNDLDLISVHLDSQYSFHACKDM